MQVLALNRYPLKSAAPEGLQTGDLLLTGFSFDRQWMVVTESGKFMSQREKGAQKLALVRTALTEGGIEFSAPDMETLKVPYRVQGSSVRDVELHGKMLKGEDVGDVAADWFSRYLPKFRDETFRLVRFPSGMTRSVAGHYTNSKTAITHFADGYPVLILNAASLRDLNNRLVQGGKLPVELSVFRGNIIIEGAEPWVEDTFNEIRIGETTLQVVKPCARCPVTGVTQETGTFSSNPNEPRRTLKEFHAGKHLVERFPNLEPELHGYAMFGQNARVKTTGEINVGDEVTILSTR